MRRVNIKSGLKQRLPDILGTDGAFVANDAVAEQDIFELNPWSIQAALLSNIERLVKAVVGDSSTGRPMQGLLLSKVTAYQYQVSAGYGFTPDGKIITIGSSFTMSVPIPSGDFYVYLKHSLAIAPEANHVYGKNTTFVAETTRKELVIDDFGEVHKTDIVNYLNDIVEAGDEKQDCTGYVYLGKITVAGGQGIVADSDIINNPNRGLQNDVVNTVAAQVISELGETILSGNFSATSHTSEEINLPSGYYFTNCIIIAAHVVLPSYDVDNPGDTTAKKRMLPFLWTDYEDTGSLVIVSATLLDTDKIRIYANKHNGSTNIDLNGGSYTFVLKKIS